MEELQEKYDRIRVLLEDALYRYNKTGMSAAPPTRKECEVLFARLLQIRDEMRRA